MPASLPTMLQIARSTLVASSAGGAWLLFVEIPTKTLGTIRVVDDVRARYAAGKWWQACAIAIPDFREQSAEGALGQVTVTIPNVRRIAAAFLEAGELQGQRLGAWFQLEEWVDQSGGEEGFVEALGESHVIIAATVTEKEVTLTCGHPAGQARVPRRVFDKSVAPIFASRTAGGG